MKLWKSIDWATVEDAFMTASWQKRAYFDAVSGRALFVSEQVRQALQQIYDEVGEERADGALLDDAQRIAHQIEMDDERFWALPTVAAVQLASWRDAFAESCEPAFRRLIWSALDRNDQAAFERMLQIEPAEVERWRLFLSAEIQTHLTRWLQRRRADFEERKLG